MGYLDTYKEFTKKTNDIIEKAKIFLNDLINKYNIGFITYEKDLYSGNILIGYFHEISINKKNDIIFSYSDINKRRRDVKSEDVSIELLLSISDCLSEEFRRPIDILNACVSDNNIVGICNILTVEKELDIDVDIMETIIKEDIREIDEYDEKFEDGYLYPGIQTFLWNYRDGKYRDIIRDNPKYLSKEMKKIKELEWAFDSDELGLL